MKRATNLLALLVAGAAFVTAAPAAAASYVFDVLYSGGNSATLAPGSDDPLATTLVVGDDFVYSLTAQPGFAWSTTSAGSLFPFFALSISETGTRSVNYVLTLSENGSTIFTDANPAATNSFVHLGTNTVSVPGSLTYDKYSLSATILSATTGSTPNRLLPWPGDAPEERFPGTIVYGPEAAVVPEPATWALMIGGMGLMGAGLRRTRRSAPRVTFA